MSDVPHIRPLAEEEKAPDRTCMYCEERAATKLVMITADTTYDACDLCAAEVEQGRDDSHYHDCECWDCFGYPTPAGFKFGRMNETHVCTNCDGEGEVEGPEGKEMCVQCGGAGCGGPEVHSDD